MRPSFRLSVLAAAAIIAAPARAYASPDIDFAELANDGQNALNSGISFLRRALHLGTQEEVLSHSVALSNREATLELELAGNKTRTISLRGGHVYVDGAVAGNYAPGGTLDRSWRRALADGADLDTRALLVALRAWRTSGLTGDEVAARSHLDDALKGLDARALPTHAVAIATTRSEPVLAQAPGNAAIRLQDLAALDSIGHQLDAMEDAGPDVAEAIRRAPVRIGDVTLGQGQRIEGDLVVYHGGADVFGDVGGSVVALYGDVNLHRGAHVGRNAVSVGGTVHNDGATVDGDVRTFTRDDLQHHAAEAAPARPAPSAIDRVFTDVRDVLAVFVAFAMLGFGTVFFGRRYLEVVADTATHSFGRSFVVGLLGQLLVLPTFAMLCVGLIFTVVGILLLPFAAVAFVIAAILAVVTGYLAIAHAIGETFTRRRMAHGAFVRAPNAYGYLFTGLVGLLGLWAAAALFGFMGPVVLVFRVAAAIVTWLAATTGFGAVLLSRAGLRESFAGRHIGEMSDEYLWATPPATPTAATRAKMDQR